MLNLIGKVTVSLVKLFAAIVALPHCLLWRAIQWGSSNLESSAYFGNITYPISFRNIVLGVVPYDVVSNFNQSKGLTVNLAWVTDKSNLKTGNVASNCAGSVVGVYRYLAWGK